MTNINRTLSALALATISLSPVFAQSANRTIVGVPVQPKPNVTIVESAEVRNCRLHCGSLAATNLKAVPTAAQQQMRADDCRSKMIRNR